MDAKDSQKIITCILPKEKAMPLVRTLAQEQGLNAVDLSYARGVGRITPLLHRGIGETSERAILTIAVPASAADDYFELIYEIAEINHPHGGLMFMHGTTMATGFALPDLPEEQ
ncbi:hypothetical protein G3480_17100 [Thiorhodococcus mannitoliphagus]|uniref:P-II family nitrogen regulator n=1 Tax=Thiorhodococcus mannitoliphagus TaxID=329406 RepID=A0A6P1DYB8_9GAMM|nr:hypothetical protein [Thiorhodococcus mannitoliphagus]NEX22001.1 hypothetical protein [Thiorhodococcus mannitoliphagus]